VPGAEAAVGPSRLERARGLTRAADWWNHKVPVILTFAYWVLLGEESRPVIGVGQAWWSVVAFLAAVVGVAGLGHVINDIFDAEQDRRAGRSRPAAGLRPQARRQAVAALLALALAPWLYLPSDKGVWALLGLEVALLVAYSSPPVRAKERGALALVFDASYAYIIPILLTLATFVALPVGPTPQLARVATAAALWSLAVGMRGIAFHQLDDLESDRAAGVDTWATRAGRDHALRRIAPAAIAEPLLFCGLVLTLADRLPLLPWLLAGVVGWRAFQLRFLAGYERAVAHTAGEQRLRRLGFDYLNDLYERWLPTIILGTLFVRSPAFWPLLVGHALVFENGPVDFVRRDLRLLPSVRFTAAYWLTYWLGRARAWRVRRQLRRLPGTPSSPPDRGRFVFVVCGPDEHIQTLHLALDRLRPRTNQEILVVTDSTRNDLAIEHDRIVDVAVPPELDDHQASIWLKTSLHRHVPLDRTSCYLDSDIVAVRPDVDAVFDHHGPPVTFAPDRMIRENCVDRFSPWAMTCACTGMDEVASCEHLREALFDRWSVEPPGDWMHWNGGVFLFGPESGRFLEAWHRRTLEALSDPRFKTRDQHTLIATVWAEGLEEHPMLPREFNTIVDLGSYYLTWYGGSRYAVHPDEPPVEARFLHLYSNALHLAGFDISTDVEEVVLRNMAHRSADSVRELRVIFGPRRIVEVTGLRVAHAGSRAAHAGSRAAHAGSRAGSRVIHVGSRATHAVVLASRWCRRTWWVVVERVVWPAVNLTRRVGRSIARRGRVLRGRETSPGGRRSAFAIPKGWSDRPLTSTEVAAYYDDWNERYAEAFGDVLQTFRSTDPQDFLMELGEMAGLQSGQRVLDAGCGIGGPAMLYAQKFGIDVEGVTVSQAQVDTARPRIAGRGLDRQVRVEKGDFHRLEGLYEPESFDVVYFLESLCHSDHPEVVLASVATVLKPGGVVFIKDLYRNTGTSPEEEADIEIAVRNTEHHCHLNVWRRQVILEALRATGFEVELDHPFPLFADFDYDTGNDFVNDNDIDIFEGRPSTYLEHAAIRARKPAA